MNWLEVFGWLGSILVVVSLVVNRATRFRVLNLLGCLVATTYNWVLGIWPYMAMNAVISVVDAWWLWRLHKEEKEKKAAEVSEASTPEALVPTAVEERPE